MEETTVQSKNNLTSNVIKKNNTPENAKGFFKELFSTAFIVLVILLPIRYFIAQPFIVVGASMYPTFANGDYLIVDEISFRFEKPKRGEVIVFRPPQNLKDHYIKRIIGLPGEKVSVNGNEVIITNKENPNGFKLTEPYISSMRDAKIEMTLKDNEYFVMGDNREVSSDSRSWGALPANEISGRVFLRLLPIKSIGALPGNIDFSAKK